MGLLTLTRKTGFTSGTLSRTSENWLPIASAWPSSETTWGKLRLTAALERILMISAASSEEEKTRSAITCETEIFRSRMCVRREAGSCIETSNTGVEDSGLNLGIGSRMR